ncbi:iron-sulfur cluster assembly scaffold protein [Maricaulis sp.]|uniref:iron-sulfur cluster assembly scaffold protein n=1 Tax=Maricaulis sp. TaxID=1486257 RepID=UPI00260A0E4F|nr:iron-sulfur cluster assembly scaffold protein [Maricaulis sp.]
MAEELYSNAVLRLAADIPRIGRLARPQASARKVSRLCGSEVEVDIVMQGDKVADLALRVKACALGQASASVLARQVIGASQRELEMAKDSLLAMLKQGKPMPRGRFSELAVLEGARAYPARHQSVMLAFEAVTDAARQAGTGRTPAELTG